MIHVEFIGLPGSGKSTIHKHFIELLRQKRRKLYSSEEALMLSLKHASVKRANDDIINQYIFKVLPKYLFRLLLTPLFNRSRFKFLSQNRFLASKGKALQLLLTSEVFNCMSFEEKTTVLSWFLQLVSKYQLISEGNFEDAIIIFDEGFIQNSMSFFISPSINKTSVNRDELFHYFQIIPIPDIVVFVKADVTRCLERMKKREFPNRLGGKTDSVVSDFLHTCQHFFEKSAKRIEHEKKMIIRIDNNASLECSIKQLANTIQQNPVLQ